MGRFFVQPVVIKNKLGNSQQLKPYWNKVIYQHHHCGDILGLFQLNYMVMIFFAIINYVNLEKLMMKIVYKKSWMRYRLKFQEFFPGNEFYL